MSAQIVMGEWAIDPRDCWATPQYLFDEINKELEATVDSCAIAATAKIPRFWGPVENGLIQNWRHERVFCNPPYSSVDQWVEKCKMAECACLLAPVSSDVAWWHSAMRGATVIDFFRGRVQFLPPPGIEASTCNGRHCLIWFGLYVNDDLNEPVRMRSRCAKTGVLL